MSVGANYYGLIGYNIISDLVNIADYDGNFKFDENYLPDMEFYQDKDCVFSAKRIKELILTCHLEHHNGEDGVHIQMRVWDDYCEIWNEGELPAGYTPETLMGQHSSRPRNRNIAYAFFKAGFIDAWGRGYKKIREGFEGAGLPMPKIESAFGGVRVTFQRNNVNNPQNDINVVKDVIKDVTKELSERQKVILELVAANSFVTTTEMSQKTGVVLRTIMRDLDDLQEKGFIKRKGGRKDGEWIIIGEKK